MADYTVRCLNCFHDSHEGKPCAHCPADTKENPNIRCKDFVRPDLFAARCLGRIEQGSMQAHGQLMMGLSAMFDLLAEAFPEAADRMKAKLEEQQKKHEEEIAEQQKQREAEAAEAYDEAKKADEERYQEDLVEEYTNNVVPFRPTVGLQGPIPEDIS